MVTATHGYRHEASIDAAKSVMSSIEKTTEFDIDFTENLDDLNADNLAEYDLLRSTTSGIG